MCCKNLWNMCDVVTPIGPAIPARGFSSGLGRALSLMSTKRANQLSSSLSFLSNAGFVWGLCAKPAGMLRRCLAACISCSLTTISPWLA
jgi:hypothetical protein